MNVIEALQHVWAGEWQDAQTAADHAAVSPFLEALTL
jgi:hypothetical protein